MRIRNAHNNPQQAAIIMQHMEISPRLIFSATWRQILLHIKAFTRTNHIDITDTVYNRLPLGDSFQSVVMSFSPYGLDATPIYVQIRGDHHQQ